jgi:hypothetical protein
LGRRLAAATVVALIAACILSSCGGAPTAQVKKSVRSILTTTSTTAPTTSTSATAPTTTQPGIAVPNVVGLKIAAARTALRGAGLSFVSLNAACDKGTLASQSVVAALATPGKGPDVRVGALPLSPGAVVQPGSRVAITWSGCYGDASSVPAVVGLTFVAARQAIHAVWLAWACFSVGKAPATTTTRAPRTTTTTSDTSTSTSTTTTLAPTTTTTKVAKVAKVAQTVLTQSPAPQVVLHPGAIVTLTMHHCPQ